MPTSPFVEFKFQNNNVLQTTPTMGISCVLARTTKGPKDDPSDIITTYSNFQRVYGSEIVPDGSVSNIEKALDGGSKLRVVRVLGSGASKGTVDVTITFTSEGTTYSFSLETIGYGDSIGSADTFTVSFYKTNNTIYYKIYSASGTVLEYGPVVTYKTADDNNSTSVDYLALSNFAKNSDYIEPVMSVGSSFENMVKWLQEEVDGTTNAITVTINGAAPSETETSFTGTVGSAGDDPTADDWIASLEYIKDYTDFYQLFFSHLSQHLTSDSDVLKVYKEAATLAKELQEFVLYIEVPKYTTHYTEGTDAREYKSQATWVQTCLGTIGNSRYIAYFGGGLYYYNENGNLQASDVLGTVVGLGDASASSYGPWKSFAGMNRGLVTDAQGPVCPNYGSASRYDELNTLANNYINEMVIKDTPSSGKQTMLWHCFTSQVKQDSERFLSIVRLNLYLKKFLRPILNKYIEEPNIWTTWQKIWLEVKPTLDYLVDEDAMTEYTWMGDQDATSYDDLSVNNEADVRQGKYRAILKYKDVVPMQEITMEIVIEAASSSVSVTETSSSD